MEKLIKNSDSDIKKGYGYYFNFLSDRMRRWRRSSVPVQDVPMGLPKNVQSMCPRCRRLINAVIFEEDGRVYMEKSCTLHGYFRDLIYSDVELYLKVERWTFEDGRGILNPQVTDASVCPLDCGICQMHKSNSALTNIDLTNRCNLNCPICFASANSTSYVYELSVEQIREMMEILKNVKPVPTTAIQYSGGEPTIHPDFIQILEITRDAGFSHIQVATNGIRFAKSLEFSKRCKEAGLYTLYLQFDGIGDDPYIQTRNVRLWKIKQKAVENARLAGLKIVLVPTIVRTVNEDQVGKILQFAIDNADVISGISYQPIAFTGRYDDEEVRNYRFTLSDLTRCIEEQTGYARSREDWYPLSVTSPFSKFLSKVWQRNVMEITCHSNCGIGTYFFINRKDGIVIPITRIVDIEGLMTDFFKLSKKSTLFNFRTITNIQALRIVRRHFLEDNIPEGFSEQVFMEKVDELLDKSKAEREDWDLMLVAGMHFQDCFNFNVDRVKRCSIHYACPDGRLYPFCTYNSGPLYRRNIERRYSVPKKLWLKKNGAEYVTEGFYKD